MKKLLGSVIRPTNRGVRILVGLLLAGLLCIQVTRSIATNKPIDKIDWDYQSVESKDRLRELAETNHLELLKMCREEFVAKNIGSYTCTFVKQEQIRGSLSKEQHINVKFMPKPFSVAMHWVKNAPIGDAVVYVEGKYKNDEGRSQMVVRPANKFFQRLVGGSVLKLPDGAEAMRNTLRPCTMFGFVNSLDSLIEVYQLADKREEATNKFGGYAEVDGRKCIVLERYLPYRKDYPAKKTLTFIDVEYKLPVRVIGYDWKDKLNCNYEYRNVDFAAALRPTDFTPKANKIKRQ